MWSFSLEPEEAEHSTVDAMLILALHVILGFWAKDAAATRLCHAAGPVPEELAFKGDQHVLAETRLLTPSWMTCQASGSSSLNSRAKARFPG